MQQRWFLHQHKKFAFQMTHKYWVESIGVRSAIGYRWRHCIWYHLTSTYWFSRVDMTQTYHRWALRSKMYWPCMSWWMLLPSIWHWTSKIGWGMGVLRCVGSDFIRQTHEFSYGLRRFSTWWSKRHIYDMQY